MRLYNFKFLFNIKYFFFIFTIFFITNELKKKLMQNNKFHLDQEHKLNPELNTYLNLNINSVKLCDTSSNKTKDFIFIYSFTRINDFLIRKAIRKTWANLTLFPSIKLAFILGKTDDRLTSSLIQNESDLNGDIIQGNFTDTYRNLTYKLLTAFKWISKYCTNAKFIVRIHGDIFLNTFHINFLSMENIEDFYK